MKKLSGCLILFLIFACSHAATAHDLWINCTDHYVQQTEAGFHDSKVYLGWGHRFPVDDFIPAELLTVFELIDPQGGITPLEAIIGGYTAAELEFEMPGSHIVSVIGNSGYYTMYMENGEMHHSPESMENKENVIISAYFEEYAKCLVFVGDERDNAFAEPLNHDLEIVPITDPRDLKVGDMFEFQVLFEGRPASFTPVTSTYSGFSSGMDMAYSTGVGMDGYGAIRILHWGPQMLNAKIERPPEDDHIGKCQYERYSATLTFEVR